MFYGLPNERAEEFNRALESIRQIYPVNFAGDMLVTFNRNMGFF